MASCSSFVILLTPYLVKKIRGANSKYKLGLSCAKLRIVELKIEDKKMLGLNEN